MHKFLTNKDEIHEFMKNIHVAPDRYRTITNVSDGSVTVNVTSDIIIRSASLVYGRMPVKFGTATGNFFCQATELTSLVGCPVHVAGSFNVNNTSITSLQGMPEMCGSISMENTALTSLDGFTACEGSVSFQRCTKIASIAGLSGKAFYANLNLSGCTGLKTLNGLKNLSCSAEISLVNTKISTLENIAECISATQRLSLPVDRIKKGGLGLITIEGLKAIPRIKPVPRIASPWDIIEKYLGKSDEIFECQEELINAGFEAFATL